jgi:uncharacterized protein (DUF1015 family)
VRLFPFAALRPRPELADAVASVPYDTVDTLEAARLAAGKPHSFLHVVRAEIDLPPGADPHADAVYDRAAENFQALVRNNILVRDAQPTCYLYRITQGKYAQVGVVGCCHADDYAAGIIRRHEKTRADKETDRTRHIEALGAHTGPVFLTFRDRPAIAERIGVATAGPPMLAATGEDGSRHEIWRVDNAAPFRDAFADVPLAYIADGHHRAAAACRVAADHRARNPAHTGEEGYNRFLAVLFTSSHLRIMPYNRCVRSLNGLSPAAFLDRLAAVGRLTPNAAPSPPSPLTASLYLEGRWYGLSWEVPADADPVGRLDVSVLQERVLGPILGIDDPRTSPEIAFVGGVRGTQALAARVDAGEAAVAFSLHPVTVDDMMAIADAGQVMPPKSTWFEPKLRSGLLVNTL